MNHVAEIVWNAQAGEDFLRGRFSRAHEIRFDGGAVMPAAASPSIVPPAFTNATGVDPEEMFVASLASCHMLAFLDIARRAGVVVRSYADNAEGTLTKSPEGRYFMSRVLLRPRVDCDADSATLEDLHHKAHQLCFIANSVTTEVVVEPADEALLERKAHG